VILIDFNAICIAAAATQRDINGKDMIRHIILNGLRMHNVANRKKYGEMVICCDSKSWRKDYFPYYKANRKKSRDKSADEKQYWETVFETINEVIDDLRNFFPYKVIKVDGAEADDIIGTLARQTQEFGHFEDVLIISGDKDFAQLQKYDNVKQYSPIQKKFIVEKNPRKFLAEHILKGDKGDGVPNVKSADNVLAEGGRQTPVSKKFIDSIIDADWPEDSTAWNTEIERNFQRNKKLIDLDETPEAIVNQILEQYNTQNKQENRSKVLPYLINKKHNMLIECVDEFL
jgi:5'-3' exonuclease